MGGSTNAASTRDSRRQLHNERERERRRNLAKLQEELAHALNLRFQPRQSQLLTEASFALRRLRNFADHVMLFANDCGDSTVYERLQKMRQQYLSESDLSEHVRTSCSSNDAVTQQPELSQVQPVLQCEQQRGEVDEKRSRPPRLNTQQVAPIASSNTTTDANAAAINTVTNNNNNNVNNSSSSSSSSSSNNNDGSAGNGVTAVPLLPQLRATMPAECSSTPTTVFNAQLASPPSPKQMHRVRLVTPRNAADQLSLSLQAQTMLVQHLLGLQPFPSPLRTMVAPPAKRRRTARTFTFERTLARPQRSAVPITVPGTVSVAPLSLPHSPAVAATAHGSLHAYAMSANQPSSAASTSNGTSPPDGNSSGSSSSNSSSSSSIANSPNKERARKSLRDLADLARASLSQAQPTTPVSQLTPSPSFASQGADRSIGSSDK